MVAYNRYAHFNAAVKGCRLTIFQPVNHTKLKSIPLIDLVPTKQYG